jgi:hypothetical protein
MNVAAGRNDVLRHGRSRTVLAVSIFVIIVAAATVDNYRRHPNAVAQSKRLTADFAALPAPPGSSQVNPVESVGGRSVTIGATFSTSASRDQIFEYYAKLLARSGWTPEAPSIARIRRFFRNSDTATIMYDPGVSGGRWTYSVELGWDSTGGFGSSFAGRKL